jgi:predicted enzyme related to lactoylglutathione lyase
MEHGIRLSTVNLNAPDPSALGAFYARLLGWEVAVDEPGWVMVRGPESVALSFEEDVHHRAPVWPSDPHEPPIQMHLDVRVLDLEGAVRHAEECGAALHPHQPQDDVRVLVDPAGHVFCLWLDA